MSTRRLAARELIEEFFDDGSVESWDEPIDISGYSPQYQEELRRARERSGCDESLLTGQATVHGRRVAFIVGEFRFLAGYIGRDAANRFERAVRRPTAARIRPVASTASDAPG